LAESCIELWPSGLVAVYPVHFSDLPFDEKPDKDDRRKVLIIPDKAKAGKLFGRVFGSLQERLTALIGQYTDKELQTVKSYIAGSVAIMEEITAELKGRKK
jgi:hypothetical protein